MNDGKRFEQNVKRSVPDDVFFLRLHDSAIGFDVANSTQRFSLKSPFDAILYKYPRMFCLELKTTKQTSISFTGSSPMIKEHQIKNLKDASKFCDAGFLLNFRKTSNTYYLKIEDFIEVTARVKKCSINENDISHIATVIPHKILKVNSRYDLTVLFGVK